MIYLRRGRLGQTSMLVNVIFVLEIPIFSKNATKEDIRHGTY